MTATVSPFALFERLGRADAPTIYDVCLDDDYADCPKLIPTARRWPHGDILAAPSITGSVVIVCQKGKKLSHGAAALLRHKGVAASVLEGGNQGWDAAGLPRIPWGLDKRPAAWVTTSGGGIDTLAAAWLIRRFADPEAPIMAVPASELSAVAEMFQAHPFGPLHGGFAALSKALNLKWPALARLQAALTATPWLELEAERAFSSNRLAATIPLLDCAYEWAAAQPKGDMA
ncbi:MAG: chromate resistance protein ChrB domain-containing protein [Pseudomonadota bacterium]